MSDEQTSKRESVLDYPRPPKVEATTKHIKIIYDGVLLAETKNAVRVLEKGHPPVYYIPQKDIRMEYLVPSPKTSTCEFKGQAAYFHLKSKSKNHENVAWSYPAPTTGYEAIKDYIAFYPKPMDACFVDGERVIPEPGEYYGGWITSEIDFPAPK